MLRDHGCWFKVSRERSRAACAIVALVGLGLVACSEDVSGPPAQGSIVIRTATAGFLKAESFALVVDGVAEGTIGAADEVTLTGLDPRDYAIGLGDIPDNCSAEDTTAAVVSGETTEVTLTVTCSFAEPVEYTIQFTRQRPNLDTGEVVVCPFGICSTQDGWDLYVENNPSTEPRSIVRLNTTTEVAIAHLPGVSLDDLTEADYEAATFGTEAVDDPFDAGRVILIRTDLGNVYALGDPSEDLIAGTVTFHAALIVQP